MPYAKNFSFRNEVEAVKDKHIANFVKNGLEDSYPQLGRKLRAVVYPYAMVNPDILAQAE